MHINSFLSGVTGVFVRADQTGHSTEDGRSYADFMYWPINLQCFSVVNLGFFGNVYLLPVTKYFFALLRWEKYLSKIERQTLPEQVFARLKSLYLYGSGGFWSNLVEKTEIFSQFSIFFLFCTKRAAYTPKK